MRLRVLVLHLRKDTGAMVNLTESTPQGLKRVLIESDLRHPSTGSGQALKSCPDACCRSWEFFRSLLTPSPQEGAAGCSLFPIP